MKFVENVQKNRCVAAAPRGERFTSKVNKFYLVCAVLVAAKILFWQIAQKKSDQSPEMAFKGKCDLHFESDLKCLAV